MKVNLLFRKTDLLMTRGADLLSESLSRPAESDIQAITAKLLILKFGIKSTNNQKDNVAV